MPLIIPANTISGGYEVDNSLRFDDGSSDKLSKNIASSGNRKTWTWSAWIKRANIPNANMDLFATPYVSLSKGSLYIDTSERLYYAQYESGGASNNFGIRTTRLFRDPSAWYHIVLIWDTTNGTGDDRIRLYINGTRETDLSLNTNPTLNYDGVLNNSTHDLYVGGEASSLFFDGYMAEVVFIDGQALEPTSFGETDEDTGIWKPIDVSGLTFGTNGFYLDFENSGSLGADVSGNGNNFTVNNLTSIDQTTDTPTNNYCTLNPLDVSEYIVPGEPTFSEGNTVATTAANDDAVGTFGVDQGKWYFEIEHPNGGSLTDGVGFVNIDTEQEAIYRDNGDFRFGGSQSAYAATWQTAGDIIGVALDLDNTTISFYKNGVSQGNAKTDLPSGTYMPILLLRSNAGTSIFKTNFGNPAFTISSGNSDANGYGNFEYAVPSGYYALNTKNLSEFG